MSTYIRAVVAAMAIEEKYGIPLGDLVDTEGKPLIWEGAE